MDQLPASVWGGLDTASSAPSSRRRLLDQRSTRWSSSGHARGTSAVAAYRDHSVAAQCGLAPSVGVGWPRYGDVCSFVATSPTRPAEGFAGRVVGTSLRGPDVSRPFGSGSVWVGSERRRGVVSIRRRQLLRRDVAYSTSGQLAGRVVRTSLRGPEVSRPLGNGSVWAGSERRCGVVSIRRRLLLRRDVAYSTSGQLAGRVVRTSLRGPEVSRPLGRGSAWASSPASVWGGLDTATSAPSSRRRLLDQRVGVGQSLPKRSRV